MVCAIIAVQGEARYFFGPVAPLRSAGGAWFRRLGNGTNLFSRGMGAVPCGLPEPLGEGQRGDVSYLLGGTGGSCPPVKRLLAHLAGSREPRFDGFSGWWGWDTGLFDLQSGDNLLSVRGSHVGRLSNSGPSMRKGRLVA